MNQICNTKHTNLILNISSTDKSVYPYQVTDVWMQEEKNMFEEKKYLIRLYVWKEELWQP